jgi:hypothetical protein
MDSNNLMFAKTSSSNRQATRFLSFGTSKELFTTPMVSLTKSCGEKRIFLQFFNMTCVLHMDSISLTFAKISSSNRQAARFLSFGSSKEFFITVVVSLTNLVKKKRIFCKLLLS